MMRQWFLGLLLLALAGVASASPMKIGFVDLDKALRELPEAQAGAANLNKQVAAKQKAIEAKRQQIDSFQKTLEKDFPHLSNAQRQDREAQLQSMILSLQQFQQQAQDSLNYQRNQILKNIQNQLVKVVSQIGKTGHYTVILNDKSVLYVSGAIDLTGQVVAAMKNTALPSVPPGKKP
ncbi:OmpH family outer membrane protein [Acidithiobacillus montserratensis]|uniref:OmpH family outer membrane protein n=1 Tax=Acidithiobacillus montserratensis TaxID=2729135 RepID=A0ACD5HBQ7_9PROT|nr:OmpH family outer membrane protein [Acidithiobacillus montserratensis]MBU2747658.1 OmpH family outer membrane protein [Acidithiobacillus montserratensis]